MPRQRIRLHDLSGKDVVARAESVKVGMVSDVLFSPSDGHVGAVLVETGGGFGGFGGETHAIPGSAIQAIGPDAIIITDRASVLDKVERIDRTGLVSAGDLKGRTVVTDDGERLGSVTDFDFDLESGRLIGYVIGPERGGGFDLGMGRERESHAGERVIPVHSDVIVGPDLITVPAETLRRGREEGYMHGREEEHRHPTEERRTGFTERGERTTYSPGERETRSRDIDEEPRRR